MSTLTADSIIDHAYRRGALMVIACGFLWSLAGIGVRLTEEATGWHIVFYRSIGLSITLLAYMMWRNKGHVIGSVRGIGLIGFIAGCLTGASFLAISLHSYTPALPTSPLFSARRPLLPPS